MKLNYIKNAIKIVAIVCLGYELSFERYFQVQEDERKWSSFTSELTNGIEHVESAAYDVNMGLSLKITPSEVVDSDELKKNIKRLVCSYLTEKPDLQAINIDVSYAFDVRFSNNSNKRIGNWLFFQKNCT